MSVLLVSVYRYSVYIYTFKYFWLRMDFFQAAMFSPLFNNVLFAEQ